MIQKRDNAIQISQLNKKLIVRFSNESVNLPVEWQEKVDEYWQSLIDSGKTYTRGEVFTVTKNKEDNDAHNILVEKSDYAHYLYCQNIDPYMGGHGIRVIFTSCLVETSDNKTIFGRMGDHTARAEIYQLAGGGIDSSDIKDGVFDFKGNISKELLEEFDIDVHDNSRVNNLDVVYIKQGGKTKKIAVVFRITLNETSEEFLEKYKFSVQNLKQKNGKAEFGDIVVLEKSKDEIEQFFKKNRENCDEYMEPLLKFVYCSKQ